MSVKGEGKVCTKCNKPFKMGVTYPVMAEGKYWHRECFNCAGCRKPLWGDSYYLEDDEISCDNCFSKKQASLHGNCAHCNKPITGAYIEAEGLKLHQECMKCPKCKRPLEEGFMEDGGKIYHLQCLL